MEPSSNQNQEGAQKKPNRGGRGQKKYRGNNRGGKNYYNNNYQNNNRYPQQYQMYPHGQSSYYNPYFQQQILYRTEMYICSRYRHLIDINQKNAKLIESINANSKFFVIKSFSEEDVHKSIKYNVWSSSKDGNLTLSNAYRITEENKGNVYLFFSCNGSGRYCGLARMKSPCDENKTFGLWTQDGKWPGLFDVEWLFIKDVPFKEFKNVIITMKDGEVKPISNSRDTQEIPFEQAKIMIQKITDYQNTNTILEHFEFYDMRQENYERNMQMNKSKEMKANQENKQGDNNNDGLTKAIGVSNYNVQNLLIVLSVARIKPLVNEVEFHPYLYQKDLLEFCNLEKIKILAYNPLVKGVYCKERHGKEMEEKKLDLLNEPEVKSLAEKHGKTPGQIVLNWEIQKGVIPIPGTSKPERMKENLEAINFQLDQSDCETLEHYAEHDKEFRFADSDKIYGIDIFA